MGSLVATEFVNCESLNLTLFDLLTSVNEAVDCESLNLTLFTLLTSNSKPGVFDFRLSFSFSTIFEDIWTNGLDEFG